MITTTDQASPTRASVVRAGQSARKTSNSLIVDDATRRAPPAFGGRAELAAGSAPAAARAGPGTGLRVSHRRARPAPPRRARAAGPAGPATGSRPAGRSGGAAAARCRGRRRDRGLRDDLADA